MIPDFDVHAFYDEDLQLFLSPSGQYEGDETNGPKDLISHGAIIMDIG